LGLGHVGRQRVRLARSVSGLWSAADSRGRPGCVPLGWLSR
jgi:hypothetical protein